MQKLHTLNPLLPGVLLCVAITLAAVLLEGLERWLFGRAWIEALVLAILIGAALRTTWTPKHHWHAGIQFSAKMLLEVAVVLLGATISAGAVLRAGLPVFGAIMATVVLAIGASYLLGRLFGLSHHMATLIACGNSICGNSAIAAVAPVIGADGEDIAASIAFTAVLGVAVVLGLPELADALHLTPRGFGILAGLTVYAVPQVLAATAPAGVLPTQVGTLVKLVRVLMLGPVILFMSLFPHGEKDKNTDVEPIIAKTARQATRPSLHQLVPWFILGFLALMAVRSAGLLPHLLLTPANSLAGWLTVISMAALGLGVDVRAVARAGLRVTAVVTLSLVMLGGLSLILIESLRLG